MRPNKNQPHGAAGSCEISGLSRAPSNYTIQQHFLLDVKSAQVEPELNVVSLCLVPCDLTWGVVSLHQEAEPIVHVVVRDQLTPVGVTQARGGAQRPVARLQLLEDRKQEVQKHLYP